MLLGGGGHHPVDVTPGFFLVTEAHERVDGEGGVTQPGEAVIPVARAPDRLRQAGGWRGDDRSGGSVDEHLEHQAAAQHGITPRPVIRSSVAPLLPPANSRVKALLELRALGERQRPVSDRDRAQRQQRTPTFGDRKTPSDRIVVIDLGFADIPGLENDGIAVPASHDPVRPAVDASRTVCVPEAGRDPPGHGHLAADALDSTDQLAHRTIIRLQRQRVGYAHRPPGRVKSGLQHVG